MAKDRVSSSSSGSRGSRTIISKIYHPIPGNIDYGAILLSHDVDGVTDLDCTDIETPNSTTSSTASLIDSDGSNCSVRETSSNLIALVTGAGMLSLPASASYTGWITILILIGVAFIFMYTFSLLAESIETLVLRMRVSELGSSISSVVSTSPMRPNVKMPVHLMVQSPDQEGFTGNSFSDTDLASKAKGNRIDDNITMKETTNIISGNSSSTFIKKIDYVILARASLGRGSEKLILSLLFLELVAALVSFMINIGTNIELLGIGIDMTSGIVLTSVVSCILSSQDMRNMAMSSMVGLMLTSLTLVSLILSGYQTIGLHGSSLSSYREFKTADITYAPLSFFIIAFCFGGHSAFPPIYVAMKERRRYPEVLLISGVVICAINVAVLITGYYVYAQFTQLIVTVNIGRDFYGNDVSGGSVLRSVAALGIIFNLQVTCPLIVLTLRNLALRMISKAVRSTSQRRSSNSRSIPDTYSKYAETLCAVGIIATACLVAIFLRANMGSIFSISTIATILNSIILPLVFYHCLYPSGQISVSRYILHIILVIAAGCLIVLAIGFSICEVESDVGPCALLPQPHNSFL